MRWTIAFLLAAALGTSSCGKKTRPAKGPAGDATAPARPSAAARDKKEEDEVGAEDVVDYLIGKKQMDIRREAERRIRKIEADHSRRIEEAMEEYGPPSAENGKSNRR